MKFRLLASFSLIAGALTFATITSMPAPVDAADACKTSAFKTELVKTACEKGGQKAAKDAMKAWNKEKKLKSCNQCHAKLAPNYELKADGVEQFKKLGGKLLDKPATTAPTTPKPPATPTTPTTPKPGAPTTAPVKK
jgi:hypothetical protein